MEKFEIVRSGQKILMPKLAFDEIYASGRYITLNKIKRSYGFYYQVMVCKKEGSRLVERTALARRLIKAPPAVHVDHIDRDPLNNMPENLRLTTASSNGANRKKASGTKYKYKGVAKRKGCGWTAQIKKDGISYSCGTFKSQREAALYYDKMASWLFGEHAGLNFENRKGNGRRV